MSEQVKRVWISTRAHDRATGEWLTVKGYFVPAADYDAVHAEAEALRDENGRLREERDNLPGMQSMRHAEGGKV